MNGKKCWQNIKGRFNSLILNSKFKADYNLVKQYTGASLSRAQFGSYVSEGTVADFIARHQGSIPDNASAAFKQAKTANDILAVLKSYAIVFDTNNAHVLGHLDKQLDALQNNSIEFARACGGVPEPYDNMLDTIGKSYQHLDRKAEVQHNEMLSMPTAGFIPTIDQRN